MKAALLPLSAVEERANVLTHAAGTAIACIAGVALVSLAVMTRDPVRIVSAVAFAGSMLLLFGASTLYHASVDPIAKARLKVLDHCAIYLLIAGTYTPFSLIALHGALGWKLLAVIWTLALAGIVFKLGFTGRFKLISTAIYVLMGWIALVPIRPLLAALDDWTFGWLLAGGIAYTAGTLFYHRPSLRYSHAIWHLFVIAGAACHFIAVLAQIRSVG